jgi:hypothetical protein
MADCDHDEATPLMVVRPERYHSDNRRTSSGRNLLADPTTMMLPLWSNNNDNDTEPLMNEDNNNNGNDSNNKECHESSMMEVVVETLAEVKEEMQHVLEEPVAIPVAPRDPGDHQRSLNAISLAVLVFYKVSGGPFGCEVSVQAAGALYTLLGFLLFPLLWSVPEALVTAELGSAFPEPSGRTYKFSRQANER